MAPREKNHVPVKAGLGSAELPAFLRRENGEEDIRRALRQKKGDLGALERAKRKRNRLPRWKLARPEFQAEPGSTSHGRKLRYSGDV